MQFGREPDLGVHDVVRGKVLDTLVGHAMQRLGRLHNADGMRERLQVALQRSAVRGGAEERREFVDLGGGQVVIAELVGQI